MKGITVEKIFTSVFNKYNVSKEVLVSPRRNKEIANARHISIYLIREMTEMSFPNIAKIYNRDHSTIITSYNSMDAKFKTDSAFAAEINDLKKEIMGN